MSSFNPGGRFLGSWTISHGEAILAVNKGKIAVLWLFHVLFGMTGEAITGSRSI